MYITVNLLAVKSSTTALLLAVWGVLILATAFLLAGYCISVSCQLTIMQLSLFKTANQRHWNEGLMLRISASLKRVRPLDTQSIAQSTDSLVIKGNTDELKMEVSTL